MIEDNKNNILFYGNYNFSEENKVVSGVEIVQGSPDILHMEDSYGYIFVFDKKIEYDSPNIPENTEVAMIISFDKNLNADKDNFYVTVDVGECHLVQKEIIISGNDIDEKNFNINVIDNNISDDSYINYFHIKQVGVPQNTIS